MIDDPGLSFSYHKTVGEMVGLHSCNGFQRVGELCLYTFGRADIDEKGLIVGDTYIAYEEIDRLYFNRKIKNSNGGFIVRCYLRIRDKAGKNVRLRSAERCRLKNIRDANSLSSYKVYEYILSRIKSRQLSEFKTRLDGGERVSFGPFCISGQGILVRRPFFFQQWIRKDCIVNFSLENNILSIMHIWPISEKSDLTAGQIRCKNLGRVKDISNLHIMAEYLNSVVMFFEDKNGIRLNPNRKI